MSLYEIETPGVNLKPAAKIYPSGIALFKGKFNNAHPIGIRSLSLLLLIFPGFKIYGCVHSFIEGIFEYHTELIKGIFQDLVGSR